MAINPNIPLSLTPNLVGSTVNRGITDILAQRERKKQQDIVNERQNRLLQLQEDEASRLQTQRTENEVARSVSISYRTELKPLYEQGDFQGVSDILNQKLQTVGPQNPEGVALNAALDLHSRDPKTAQSRFQQVTNQAIFDKLIPKEPSGKRINVQVEGGPIIPGIETPEGRVLKPGTDQFLPTAIKAPSRQETGGPGSLTSSQAGKIESESITSEQAVSKNVLGIENVISIVASDDFVGGLSGNALSAINSAGAQIRQLSGNAGILDENGNIDESQLEVSKENMNFIRRAAISNDKFESAVIELAYIKAKQVDPGSKITDKDFKFARDMLQKGADKASIITLLRESQKRAIRDYNSDTRVVNRRLKQKNPMITMEGILGGEAPGGTETDSDVSDRLIKEMEERFQ